MIITPEDKATLEMARDFGFIKVTQDNQAQLQRLAELGLLKHDNEKPGYTLTAFGLTAI
jgi:hypothetical protein